MKNNILDQMTAAAVDLTPDVAETLAVRDAANLAAEDRVKQASLDLRNTKPDDVPAAFTAYAQSLVRIDAEERAAADFKATAEKLVSAAARRDQVELYNAVAAKFNESADRINELASKVDAELISDPDSFVRKSTKDVKDYQSFVALVAETKPLADLLRSELAMFGKHWRLSHGMYQGAQVDPSIVGTSRVIDPRSVKTWKDAVTLTPASASSGLGWTAKAIYRAVSLGHTVGALDHYSFISEVDRLHHDKDNYTTNKLGELVPAAGRG